MRLIFTFCSLFIFTISLAQTITTKNITLSELPIHSLRNDSGNLITTTLPGGFSGTARMRKWNSSANLLHTLEIPNDNPSFNTVNNGQFYYNETNNSLFGYGKTWSVGTPIFLYSESLLFLDSNLNVDSTGTTLVAFECGYASPISIGNRSYILLGASNNNAKLVYDDFDDSQNLSSLISNMGQGTNGNVWLLEIDNNTKTLLSSHQIGNISDDVKPNAVNINGSFLRSNGVDLGNGFFAFKIRINGDLQYHVMDPNNLGTPVHVFTGLGNNAYIVMCDNKYYVSKANINSSGNEGIDVYDDNFNLINQNYALDFSAGTPEDLACLSNDELLIFINMGSGPRSDHMRNGYSTKEAFDKGFEHISYDPNNSSTVSNLWAYDDVYMIDDIKSLHVSAYQGPGMIWGGMTIPATSGPDDYHMVIWEADISLTPATMTFSDTQAGVLDIYMNARYNPNDLTQVVSCGDCREAVITVSQNEFNNLPADFGFSNFLINIINTSSGETVSAANMGTDPNISDPNLNRYMKAELVTGGPTYALASRGQAFKVYLTPNVMTLSNDEVSTAPVQIYPNPATSFITVKTQISISSYSILNSLGQEVQKGSFPSSAQLDIQRLSKGMYYLQLNDEEQTQSFKFIKQ
ncbi:putative secreted protein (Por secretion system target) [Nonlabens ulvanivorans]|uniref:Secreted protein (Por secretion system target) n=1 Tax=Nonlabens ulvanivorans TaxID=906888 RepID=A0ABX5EA98_NONUL|nr:putative secreted protein (Por secretion system target) [Nonlabens ulvanivorans]